MRGTTTSRALRFPRKAERRTRTAIRPALEPLEGRALLAPFSVGGDPIVDPADFRVTAFASGLNFPTGVLAEPDGSLLVVVNNPPTGGTSFYNTTAQVVRLVDTNGDGVADGTPTVLANGLPGADSAIAQAGPYVITTSSFGTISFLHSGATPAAPLSLSGRSISPSRRPGSTRPTPWRSAPLPGIRAITTCSSTSARSSTASRRTHRATSSTMPTAWRFQTRRPAK